MGGKSGMWAGWLVVRGFKPLIKSCILFLEVYTLRKRKAPEGAFYSLSKPGISDRLSALIFSL